MKVGPFTIRRRSCADDAQELKQLQKLYVACLENDLPALRSLALEGVDLHLRDGKMRTLLHMACRAEAIQFLLESGCDPLALDIEKSTTLMHPRLDGKANQLLLARGVDVHARDIHGYSALYRQCDFGGIGWDNPDLEALKVLLDAGIANGNWNEIDSILADARACVTSAGENNDVSILETFLKKYQRGS